MLVTFLLFIQIFCVTTFNHQKPIAEKIWSVRCKKHDHVLNDCNWCWCGDNHHFQCKARICEEVDVFGHFKDTIQELDVGMEGHGVWRSRPASCAPGVKYQRGKLLCVCDNDGYWPNPVCRDIFRILHPVEVTEKVEESTSQTCSPTKLYLVGCNTCFCPSTGKLDASLCTNRTCSDGDPVLEPKYDEPKKVKESEDVKDELKEMNAEREDDEDHNDDKEDFKDIEELVNNKVELDDPVQPEINVRSGKELEIYASCNTQKTYSMGGQECGCLSNNRLICKDYDDILTRGSKGPYLRSQHVVCKGNAGRTITFECNICVCIPGGYMFCTLRKCLDPNKIVKKLRKVMQKFEMEPIGSVPIDELDCIPKSNWKRGCNTCTCQLQGKKKMVICTVDPCDSKNDFSSSINVCVANTTYETGCKRCSCEEVDGERYEICTIGPQCQTQKLNVIKIESLDSLNGACKPGATYRHHCNTCKCMPSGNIMRCSSILCPGVEERSGPIEVDLVPVKQALRETCPKGHSYKVQCNLCVCLSNGNALCTTKDCSKTTD